VNLWISNNTLAIQTYGEINTWDTSPVTDMVDLFQNKPNFNNNISNWNVSSVIAMSGMFEGASAFNQDIGGWNVSSVTNMDSMFQGASAFDQDISIWNVSSVTNMSNMFNAANMSTQDWTSSSNFKNKLDYLTSVIGFYSNGENYTNVSSTTPQKPKINL